MPETTDPITILAAFLDQTEARADQGAPPVPGAVSIARAALAALIEENRKLREGQTEPTLRDHFAAHALGRQNLDLDWSAEQLAYRSKRVWAWADAMMEARG